MKAVAAFALEATDQADVDVLTVFLVAIAVSALTYFRSGAGALGAQPQALSTDTPASP